jgi:hypothetical protein
VDKEASVTNDELRAAAENYRINPAYFEAEDQSCMELKLLADFAAAMLDETKLDRHWLCKVPWDAKDADRWVSPTKRISVIEWDDVYGAHGKAIEKASLGFDWDHGRLILHPAIPLTIYESPQQKAEAEKRRTEMLRSAGHLSAGQVRDSQGNVFDTEVAIDEKRFRRFVTQGWRLAKAIAKAREKGTFVSRKYDRSVTITITRTPEAAPDGE